MLVASGCNACSGYICICRCCILLGQFLLQSAAFYPPWLNQAFPLQDLNDSTYTPFRYLPAQKDGLLQYVGRNGIP